MAAPASAKVNPETNAKLGPTDDPGHYLSYPTPTYQWHGCQLTSRAQALDLEEIPGAPAFGKGTKQSAVTFTVTPTQPCISWKVKPGYKICGVQASVLLGRPDEEVRRTMGGKTYSIASPRDITVFVNRSEARDFSRAPESY